MKNTKPLVTDERIMREKLQSKCQEALQVIIFATKGRGVKTTHCFKMKEFLVEYAGELLT